LKVTLHRNVTAAFVSPVGLSRAEQAIILLIIPNTLDSRVLGMIKRIIRFKDTSVMMSLYKILARPHVEY